LTNSKIKDAAVVGLPDETAGELPLAFVVKNSNVELTEKQVEQFLNGKYLISKDSICFNFVFKYRKGLSSKETSRGCHFYFRNSQKSQWKNSQTRASQHIKETPSVKTLNLLC
jgi:acyl-CoA synthetase (AMP-forming)/AMP-acid ligase II